MSAQDWSDLGLVFRAGAHRARGWSFNADRQQDADILDAQADQCMEIARDRDGNPPVTHIHDHEHGTGKGREQHRHVHDHEDGETTHEGHYNEPAPKFPGWGES
jgi:hypothetical protein